MTTINPRITVTLQPQVHAVLRRLSEVTKSSQSALIGELLSESLPVFERMIEVLDAAEKLRVRGMSLPDEVKASMEHSQQRIEAQMGLAMDDLERGFKPLLADAEKVNRRGAGAAAGRQRHGAAPEPRSAPTPMSNRGVRSTTPKERKANKTHRPKGGA